MAAVKHARGVKLLLKVGDGAVPEVFVAYCTINAARSISGEAATNDFNIPDCDDPDAMGWLAREKVSLSYSVSGAGILNTPDTEIFAEWLADPLPRNCEIIVDVLAADGGVVFAGAFHLTTFEITGDRGSKMEASISLVSDGEVTVTAVAVLAADEAEAAPASRRRAVEPA
jgi:predicted secreted protein